MLKILHKLFQRTENHTLMRKLISPTSRKFNLWWISCRVRRKTMATPLLSNRLWNDRNRQLERPPWRRSRRRLLKTYSKKSWFNGRELDRSENKGSRGKSIVWLAPSSQTGSTRTFTSKWRYRGALINEPMRWTSTLRTLAQWKLVQLRILVVRILLVNLITKKVQQFPSQTSLRIMVGVLWP